MTKELKTSRPTITGRHQLLLVVIMVVFLSVLIYSLITGNRIIGYYQPLVDASNGIKFETALGHLVLEDIMGSDGSGNIATVWVHLDKSAAHALAMLKGGEDSTGLFSPVGDAVIRSDVEAVQVKIEEFRSIAQEMWASAGQTGVGSDTEQRLDVVFNELISQADKVESALQYSIARGLRRFQTVQGILIALCLGLSGGIGVAYRRYERRQILAKLDLQESAGRMVRSQRIAHMGNWVWDLKNDTQHWSDEAYRILGLEPQSIKASFETFLSMIHPDDKDRFRRKAKALLAQEEDPGAEYRIIRTNGEERHIWLESLVFCDETGAAIRMEGITLDITERRQAEEVLRESEERLSRFFDASPAGLGIWDDQLRYVRINSTLARINGVSVEDHLGKTIQEVLPDLASTIEPLFQRVLETGEPVLDLEVSGEVPREPGLQRHWTVSYFPTSESSAQSHAVGGVIIDITARKRAEAALRQSEENLHITLDSIGDGVIATDTHGNVTRMNPVAASLTGWTFEQARGKSLTEVFHVVNSQTREAACNPVSKVIESGEIVGLGNHALLIAKDGSEFQISDSASPILNAGGVLIGVVMVFRDVSEDYTGYIQHFGRARLE